VIIESRRYRLHPGKLQEYLACFAASPGVLDLLQPRLAGFWFTESGELNTVHHLWRYESRAERAAVRASWAVAPAMREFFSRVTPLLQHQCSDVFDGEVLDPRKTAVAGVFDRVSVCFPPQAASANDKLAAFVDQRVAAGFDRVATLRRRLLEVAGPLCEVQLVLRSDSLAQREARWRSVAADLSTLAVSPQVASLDSQLLLAVPFSPWR
jgi:hypothetical protein